MLDRIQFAKQLAELKQSGNWDGEKLRDRAKELMLTPEAASRVWKNLPGEAEGEAAGARRGGLRVGKLEGSGPRGAKRYISSRVAAEKAAAENAKRGEGVEQTNQLLTEQNTLLRDNLTVN